MHLTKCFCLALLNLCLHVPNQLISQNRDTLYSEKIADYANRLTYEIGGIEVKGTIFTDKSALLNIAGLKVGDKVEIPGTKITNSQKSLWKLGLFSDVKIYQTKAIGEIVYLLIEVVEATRLSEIKIEGVKKSKVETIRKLILNHLTLGRKLTDSKKNNAINALKKYYKGEGFSDIAIHCQVEIERDNSKKVKPINNKTKLIFTIQKNEKVKVANINFEGNEMVANKKLKKLIGIKTKGQLFANSKLVQSQLKTGKAAIIQFYNSLGYLDAQITKESIWRGIDGNWRIAISIQEGNIYYFGNIEWKGNSVYPSSFLAKVLSIEKGDIFDQNLLNSRLQFSMEGNDVSGLYLDNGYLFFRAEAVQQSLRDDTIDLVIHILEGSQATINKVTIKGNTRTHEGVIRRELRTKPGQKFSRSDIIRSQRALMNMGYFNPESMDINTPVNPQTGTVDIEYVLEEKSNDQFELSGGWGGPQIGITGSIGITLNNFSLRKFLKPKLWNPLPMGDGQRTSIRFQSNGKAYQSLNFSFTEPWLGRKKPNSLTTAFYFTSYFDQAGFDNPEDGLFNLFGGTISLGRRLTFPDDNIISTTALGYQRYYLKDWASGFFTTDDGQVIRDGTFNNFNITQTFARSTINHLIFPTNGSKFSLSLQATFPFSFFSKKDYSNISAAELYQWLEYHKWRFNAEWYTPLGKKLVLKTAVKLGFLGSYNSEIGISPFERFQLGGDGLNNVQTGFTGTDLISLRGYEVQDLSNNITNGTSVATPIFNKFTMELRYPLSTNPNAFIYGLAFLEAGNAYQSFRDYNPFDVKRSVGFGLRAHLPMFGTLGFDYGLGFDKVGEQTWKNFAKFSIILGFEPE